MRTFRSQRNLESRRRSIAGAESQSRNAPASNLRYGRFDWFVFAWFAADIALSFVSAYEDSRERVVVDPAAIRAHYLRGWFAVDLVATVPFELLAGLATRTTASTVRLVNLIRYVRIFKILKLLRVVHLERKLKIVRMKIYPGFDQMLGLLTFALVLAHMAACFWGILGRRTRRGVTDAACAAGTATPMRRCSWMQVHGVGLDRAGDSNFDVYVTCLYWAVTTISTVGYGDYTPNATGEKLYAMVIEIVGVSMYAVVISLIGSVIATFDSKKRELTNRTNSLQRFVHKHRVPYRLARSMHAHQKRYLHAVHLWRTDEADAGVRGGGSSTLEARLSVRLRPDSGAFLETSESSRHEVSRSGHNIRSHRLVQSRN